MTIGNRIKEIRMINKMTQQQFADSLGVSRPHMSKIESNKEKASESVLRLICQLYNVDYGWIQTGNQSTQISLSYIANMQNRVKENHDLKIGKTVNILVDVLKKENVKNNSRKYYIEHIGCILEAMNNFFSRPDIEQCGCQDVEVISAYFEKKMLETLKAFKAENLDK